VQQVHVLTFLAAKEKGAYDDFTLYSGREERDPYMLTSLLPTTDGSISLTGAVKNLFEAQWMMNHTVKQIKDQLDLASKLIFQTSDSNFIGRNILTAIETGDIMVHEVNQPLTQVQNNSHDIGASESFGNLWKGLSSEINGISESMLGQNPPSGQAWHLQEALLAESHSLFELMTENKALDLERILREFVIPFLKKQMNTSKEISAVLDAQSITKIDSMFIPAEAARRYNKKAIKDTLEGKPVEPFNPGQAAAEIKAELAPLGNQRFLVPSEVGDSTWKSTLKDLEWDLEIDITGESRDKQTVLTTLSTALQTVANPAYANNPQAQLIVNKILTATGEISPIEISNLPPPAPQVPVGGTGGLQAK
jgi:hypothetical protein